MDEKVEFRGTRYSCLPVDIQVSFQRDHYRKALERIHAYAEPPDGPLEVSTEEITAADNVLKDIARVALKTCPELS